MPTEEQVKWYSNLLERKPLLAYSLVATIVVVVLWLKIGTMEGRENKAEVQCQLELKEEKTARVNERNFHNAEMKEVYQQQRKDYDEIRSEFNKLQSKYNAQWERQDIRQ